MAAARTVDPAVTGSPVISYDSTRLVEAAYLHGTVYAIVLVAMLAGIMFWQPLRALLAVTPVLLGTLWTIGFMRLFGLSFNLANVWGLPLIIGGAAEFGLNVTLRYGESGAHAPERAADARAVASTARDRRARTGAVALVLVLAHALAAPGMAEAGEPTDQIRADINDVFRALQREPASSGSIHAADSILDRMFDWKAMARASLRDHWAARTPAEQAEFTRLFATLFRRAYAARVHLVDASRFQYLGDTIHGAQATVKTKIFTKRGTPLDVDYTVHRDDSPRWMVQDVWVEKISLVDNYRVQFDSFIARSSYDGLVNRLRARVK